MSRFKIICVLLPLVVAVIGQLDNKQVGYNDKSNTSNQKVYRPPTVGLQPRLAASSIVNTITPPKSSTTNARAGFKLSRTSNLPDISGRRAQSRIRSQPNNTVPTITRASLPLSGQISTQRQSRKRPLPINNRQPAPIQQFARSIATQSQPSLGGSVYPGLVPALTSVTKIVPVVVPKSNYEPLFETRSFSEAIPEPNYESDVSESTQKDVPKPASGDVSEPALGDILEPAPVDMLEPALGDVSERAPGNILEPTPVDILEPAPGGVSERAPGDILEPAPVDILEPAPEDDPKLPPGYVLVPVPVDTPEPASGNVSQPVLGDIPVPDPVDIPEPAPGDGSVLAPGDIPVPDTVNIFEPEPVNIPVPDPVDILEPAPGDVSERAPGAILEPATVDILEPAPVDIFEPAPENDPESPPGNVFVPVPVDTPEPAPGNVSQQVPGDIPVPDSVDIPEPAPGDGSVLAPGDIPVPDTVNIFEPEPVNNPVPDPVDILEPAPGDVSERAPGDVSTPAPGDITDPGITFPQQNSTPAPVPTLTPPLVSTLTPPPVATLTTTSVSTLTPAYETTLTPETSATTPVTVTTKAPLVTTSTRLPLQTTESWINNCTNGDGYYAVTDTCDAYILCKEGEAFKHTCPDGLNFNPAARLYEYPCSYPSEVKCDGGVIEHTSTLENRCPRRYGYFAIEGGDCSKYITCQEGMPITMNCPVGLVFNTDKNTCDWPVNVPQCNLNVFRGFSCPLDYESDTIIKYRYRDHCRYYIACHKGYPRLLKCNTGLAFKEEYQMCVNQANVTDCNEFTLK